MNVIDLTQPELYFNRELSLLEFNQRVLDQAKNDALPLLDRLRFLCISCSNLDEFFEVRFSALRQQEALGAIQRGPDDLSASEQIRRISIRAHDLVTEQYDVLNEVLRPQLELESIRFLDSDSWNLNQSKLLKRYFTCLLYTSPSPRDRG